MDVNFNFGAKQKLSFLTMIAIIFLLVFSSQLCYVKRFSASILLLLFTIQIAYSGIVTAWYYANQHYIATVLCVNKDNKKMGCNGKCALNKKLSEAENSAEDQVPLSIKKPVETVLFIMEQPKELMVEYNLIVNYYAIPANNYQFTLYKDIFHPPTSSFS